MEKNRWGFSAVILGIGVVLTVMAGLFSPADRIEESSVQKPETGDGRATLEMTEAPEQEFLTKEQDDLLNQLLELMKANDLAGAASILEARKPEITKLIEVTFAGRRYLYHEDGIADSIEGRGLVLTSPSTLFYGIFAGGVPEGTSVALQALVLEEPRYDYAIGNWSDGKMSGYGTSGYTYYEGTGEADGLKTEKSGTFKDNLMEGEIRYTSISNEGNSVTWIILAHEGVTQLDERWSYKEARDEYSLLAENDESHVYLLKGADSDAAIWLNRITWDK